MSMASDPDIVPVRRQRALHRGTLRAATSTIPARSTRAGALSSRTCGDDGARRRWTRRAAPAGRRNARRRSAATAAVADRGAGSGRPLGAPAPRPSARARSAPPTIDSVRALMLIRVLPRARPSDGRSRSARPRRRELPSRARSRRPTASPRPTWTGRSSSTTCSACETATLRQIMRDPARDLLRQDRRRVHAHPGSGRRRPGSRSASRASATRPSSPPRASAPSSSG